MEKVNLIDLGRVDYKQTWEYQQELLNQLVEIKRFNRKVEQESEKKTQKHYLIFCEHNPVFTIGKSGSMDNLLLNEKQLTEQGIDFYKINRGGDITYHGPGQLVVYPIFDLDCFFTDVHKYVRYLEETVIRTLSDYNIAGERMPGFTGVWLDKTAQLPQRKICAIGVHLSRWVTMHGLAFNIQPNLGHFNHIIPCGIDDKNKAVTSLEVELMQKIGLEDVKAKVARHFSELFGFEFELVETLNTDSETI